MKKIKVLIALYGSLGLSNTIDLGDEIKIRRLKMSKNEENLFSFTNWQYFGRETCPYDWIIDFDYRYDQKDSNEPYPALLIKSRYFEYGLRLFYKNDVGFAAVVIKTNPLHNYSLSNKMLTSAKVDQFDTKIDFSMFWQKYNISYSKKPAAYEYFSEALNYSYGIKSILFCSSLESLFVPDEERSKKKDFVLQGIRILNFDSVEQKHVDDLFEFRNSYIHANKNKLEKLFSNKNVNKYTSIWWDNCETVCRKILFTHVKNPW